MKRIVFLALSLMAASVVLAVSASAAPAPKATGDYGYSYLGVQRHIDFAAIQSTTETCGVLWDVTTATQVTMNYLGVPYTHHVTLLQNGQTITGDGGYPLTGGDQYHWNIDTGGTSTIVGNTLTIHATYDLGAPGVMLTMTGTVASDGSVSGTWTDNAAGTRTGTLTMPAGSFTPLVSYCGKGTFYYTDEQGNWYFGVVKAVSVVPGDTAWFAAQILASSSNLGYENTATNFIVMQVTDKGEPGIGYDMAGGDLMNQVDAINAVNGHAAPSATVTINEGNIQVH